VSSNIIMPPVSLSDVRGTQAAEKLKNMDPKSDKIQKSAKEFEAVLLSHWLEQAEQSFASVPGSDSDPDADPGKDQFHAIAMQAVGTALAGSRGGLGIAAMVAKHLERQASHNEKDKPLETNGLKENPAVANPAVTPEVTK
jgi:Rod binding domain-containing protein